MCDASISENVLIVPVQDKNSSGILTINTRFCVSPHVQVSSVHMYFVSVDELATSSCLRNKRAYVTNGYTSF